MIQLHIVVQHSDTASRMHRTFTSRRVIDQYPKINTMSIKSIVVLRLIGAEPFLLLKANRCDLFPPLFCFVLFQRVRINFACYSFPHAPLQHESEAPKLCSPRERVLLWHSKSHTMVETLKRTLVQITDPNPWRRRLALLQATANYKLHILRYVLTAARVTRGARSVDDIVNTVAKCGPIECRKHYNWIPPSSTATRVAEPFDAAFLLL